jgi:dienelactone hydrolase
MTKAPPVWRDDALDDFTPRDVTLLGKTKRVWTTGSGPAVIVMAEMPGITPYVAHFARVVRDAGFTVYMPHLFGRDGAAPGSLGTLATIVRTCISREFRAFAANASSPVTHWLRALAALAHTECGGPGVGAIGMCFTGNFALSMMLEKAVIAPVLSQPSLPLGNPGGMHIAPDELAAVKARLDADDLTVRAYRFAGDSFCKAERFAAYAQALGDRFEPTVIDDIHANPASPHKNPHCVVTHHLIDREGEPTRAALDDILGFFAMRLKTS